MATGETLHLSASSATISPSNPSAIDELALDPLSSVDCRLSLTASFDVILDVLKHYTTYATYFRLLKASESDPNVERKKAARALARFLKLHPHNIGQKTEVIVWHFHCATKQKNGGLGKAMVITGSYLEAVPYK